MMSIHFKYPAVSCRDNLVHTVANSKATTEEEDIVRSFHIVQIFGTTSSALKIACLLIS